MAKVARICRLYAVAKECLRCGKYDGAGGLEPILLLQGKESLCCGNFAQRFAERSLPAGWRRATTAGRPIRCRCRMATREDMAIRAIRRRLTDRRWVPVRAGEPPGAGGRCRRGAIRGRCRSVRCRSRHLHRGDADDARLRQSDADADPPDPRRPMPPSNFDGAGPKQGASEPYMVGPGAPAAKGQAMKLPPAPIETATPAPAIAGSCVNPASYGVPMPPSEPYTLYEGPRIWRRSSRITSTSSDRSRSSISGHGAT